jgi:voltage-gated potassium channel
MLSDTRRIIFTLVAVVVFGLAIWSTACMTKVQCRCPDCGLLRHDIDAVHRKACGRLLNIPDEGRP